MVYPMPFANYLVNKLTLDPSSEPFASYIHYQNIVDKLIYFPIMWLDIIFVLSSQPIHACFNYSISWYGKIYLMVS